jgi:ATP-dependent DNA ligase
MHRLGEIVDLVGFLAGDPVTIAEVAFAFVVCHLAAPKFAEFLMYALANIIRGPRLGSTHRRAGAGSSRLEFFKPLMPTLVAKPPEGAGWIHEVKFDGYRSQIVMDADGVRIFTRRGLDWDVEIS